METISQYNGVYRSYADFINCNYPPAKATWCYPFAGVHRKEHNGHLCVPYASVLLLPDIVKTII